MESVIKELIRNYDMGFSDASPEKIVDLCHAQIRFGDLHLTKQNEFRDFLLHEHLISDDELFWTMFGHFYILCPQTYVFHQEIIDAINRGTRLEMKLIQRMICSNTSHTVDLFDSMRKGWKEMPEERKKEIQDLKNVDVMDLSYTDILQGEMHMFEEYLEQFTAHEDIKIYRGFMVPEDDDVRVGRTMDSPSSDIQDVGIGFSYSIDKEVAKIHAIMNSSTSLLLKLYGEDLIGETSQYKTWNEFFTALQEVDISEKIMKRTLKLYEYAKVASSSRDPNKYRKYLGFDVKPCVATYSIKKTDIITTLNFRGQERELVCLPSNTPLIRYDFINWETQQEYKSEKTLSPSLLEVLEDQGMDVAKLHTPHNMTPEFINQLSPLKMDKGIKHMRKVMHSQEKYFKGK